MRARRTVLAALTALAVITAAAAPARADSIDDKKRQAAVIAAKINSLQDRIAQLGEDYDQALLESNRLDQEVQDAQARLATKDAQLGDLKKQMAAFALSRYTSSSDPNSFAILAAGPSLADGAVQRQGYAELALGTNRDVSDELGAVMQDDQREHDLLAAKRDRQSQLAQTATEKRQAAEAAAAELDSTLKSVQADLADLVQQEADRQAAEAARKERERLAAEAAKAAQQAEAAKAAQQTVPPTAATTTQAPKPAAATAVKSGIGQAVSPPATPPKDPEPGPPRAAPPVREIPPTSAGAAIAVQAALSQVGVPYQFGQATPGVAFDCSGLTMYAWGKAGVSLPHSSRAQFDMLPHVPLDALQPGDLVFSHTPVGHVGIYIGNGQMVHAPQPGDVVKVSPVSPNAIGAGRPG